MITTDSLCRLVGLPNGRWHCAACDPQSERTLPRGDARRVCGRPPSIAERMIASIRSLLPDSRAIDSEIIERVEMCQRCARWTASRNSCSACGSCGTWWGEWRRRIAAGDLSCFRSAPIGE